MGKPCPKYTAEFKRRAVRLYNERGTTYAEVAREIGVDPSSPADWVGRASAAAPDAEANPFQMIPSMYFSPIAQTDRPRVRKRTFTNRANGPSPLPASRRPSSPAAGPSACTTCP